MFEVDFLASDLYKEAWLIQVCADVDDPATLEREVRALKEAMLEHPRAKPLMLTLESRSPTTGSAQADPPHAGVAMDA